MTINIEHLPNPHDEWARLDSQLELEGTTRFPWLGFVFTTDIEQIDNLVEVANQKSLSQGAKPAIYCPSSVEELEGTFSEVKKMAEQDLHPIWADLRKLPVTRDTQESWDNLGRSLNQGRDMLTRRLAGGLILLAHPSLKVLIQNMSPDYWSMRSITVDF